MFAKSSFIKVIKSSNNMLQFLLFNQFSEYLNFSQSESWRMANCSNFEFCLICLMIFKDEHINHFHFFL